MLKSIGVFGTRRFSPHSILAALLLLAPSLAHAQNTNTLTEAEKAQGWQLMFDGKSLSGWHSFKKAGITENGWIIKDSSIFMRGPAAGAILAPEKFVLRNFEISIDWKTPDSGNSGVFLRYLETEESENIRTGPEAQVCGKLRLDYLNGIDVKSPGACYDMYAPARPWIKPEDQFNTFHVIMYEKRVAHYGNGIKLLEYEIGSADWEAKYKVSKYRFFDLYGDIHAGKLFLQDHATPVWYRNIKIRPLTEDPWADKNFLWPDQAAGIASVAVAGPPRLRIAADRSSGLRLELDLAPATAWALDLTDARGRSLESLRGQGPDSRILSVGRSAGGAYLLSGTVGGRPFARPVPLLSAP